MRRIFSSLLIALALLLSIPAMAQYDEPDPGMNGAEMETREQERQQEREREYEREKGEKPKGQKKQAGQQSGKGSETGQKKREEKSRAWWKFWD